jgi:hypothetical protein
MSFVEIWAQTYGKFFKASIRRGKYPERALFLLFSPVISPVAFSFLDLHR